MQRIWIYKKQKGIKGGKFRNAGILYPYLRIEEIKEPKRQHLEMTEKDWDDYIYKKYGKGVYSVKLLQKGLMKQRILFKGVVQ